MGKRASLLGRGDVRLDLPIEDRLDESLSEIAPVGPRVFG
jgi:hypothetical protein